jgi:hypothetical protein
VQENTGSGLTAAHARPERRDGVNDTYEDLGKMGDIEGAILQFVEHRDWVSFPELQNHFSSFMETNGNYELSLGNDWNLVIWSGISQELGDTVLKLIREKRLFYHPADTLTYFIDGGILKLPLATRPPKGGYKKPHWVPVCLRTVPMAEPKGRKARLTNAT